MASNQSERCSGCQAELIAGARFCSFCGQDSHSEYGTSAPPPPWYYQQHQQQQHQQQQQLYHQQQEYQSFQHARYPQQPFQHDGFYPQQGGYYPQQRVPYFQPPLTPQQIQYIINMGARIAVPPPAIVYPQIHPQIHPYDRQHVNIRELPSLEQHTSLPHEPGGDARQEHRGMTDEEHQASDKNQVDFTFNQDAHASQSNQLPRHANQGDSHPGIGVIDNSGQSADLQAPQYPPTRSTTTYTHVDNTNQYGKIDQYQQDQRQQTKQHEKENVERQANSSQSGVLKISHKNQQPYDLANDNVAQNQPQVLVRDDHPNPSKKHFNSELQPQHQQDKSRQEIVDMTGKHQPILATDDQKKLDLPRVGSEVVLKSDHEANKFNKSGHLQLGSEENQAVETQSKTNPQCSITKNQAHQTNKQTTQETDRADNDQHHSVNDIQSKKTTQEKGNNDQEGQIVDQQQEDNGKYLANQQVQMELEQLNQQLRRKPDHSAKVKGNYLAEQVKENEYKQVFGQQGTSNIKPEFAFEAAVNSKQAEGLVKTRHVPEQPTYMTDLEIVSTSIVQSAPKVTTSSSSQRSSDDTPPIPLQGDPEGRENTAMVSEPVTKSTKVPISNAGNAEPYTTKSENSASSNQRDQSVTPTGNKKDVGNNRGDAPMGGAVEQSGKDHCKKPENDPRISSAEKTQRIDKSGTTKLGEDHTSNQPKGVGTKSDDSVNGHPSTESSTAEAIAGTPEGSTNGATGGPGIEEQSGGKESCKKPKDSTGTTPISATEKGQSVEGTGTKKLLDLAEEHNSNLAKGVGTNSEEGLNNHPDRESFPGETKGDEPEGRAYNKKQTQEAEFCPGSQKPKKEKKKKKSTTSGKGANDANEEPEKKFIPPGLRVTPGQGVTIHFHTIVSPEFNFKPSKDKAVVVMGGVDFGDWKHHCVELKKERELSTGYIQVTGSATFQITSVKETSIPYKYQILKNGKSMWEYIYKDHGLWNRVISLDDDACKNGGLWQQYDEVMQVQPDSQRNSNKESVVWKKATSAWSSFTSSFGLGSKSTKQSKEEVTRLVHDRQFALLSYLPKWEGFVESNAPDKLEARDAISWIQQVCQTTFHPIVTRRQEPSRRYDNAYWVLQGFDGSLFLMDYLSTRIESFGQGSDADGTIELAEKRLTSALAISLLVKQYKIQPKKEQWNNLFEGLSIPSHLKKQDCIKLVKSLRLTFKAYIPKLVDAMETFIKMFIKQRRSPQWLLILPLLHFLREDSKPFEQPQESDHLQLQWWGVGEIDVKQGYLYESAGLITDEIESILLRLVPLFEVDCLLQRTCVWLQLTPAGLAQIAHTQQAPPLLICYAFYFHIFNSYIHRNDIEHLSRCLKILEQQVLEHIKSEGSLTNDDATRLLHITSTISLNLFDKANASNHDIIAICCELFAASYRACIDSITRETRKQTNVLNIIHQEAQGILLKLLDWLYKVLPITMTYDGKTLNFQQEIYVWNRMMSVAFGTEFGVTWNTELTSRLNDRIKKLDNLPRVELFSTFDTTNLHSTVSTCLSDSAFSAIDSLINETKGRRGLLDRVFQTSGPGKYGYLLSKVLLKSWPGNEDQDKDTILKYLLNWTPFLNFVEITADEKTAYGNILTDEAQEKLAIAKSIFEVICNDIIDGSILIDQLKLITEETCCNQFIALYKLIIDPKDNIIKLIAARRQELLAIEEQYTLSECLVRMCRKIDPVDCKLLEQKLRADAGQLQLCKVCKPATLQGMPKGNLPEPAVYYFEHQACVVEILKPLYKIHESLVFGKLWTKQAAKVKRIGQIPFLSLSDVATKVWKPVYHDQLKEISCKLSNAFITLGDVELYFKHLIEKESVLKEELRRVLSFETDVSNDVLEERLSQIKDYYMYKQQSAIAGEMLNIKNAFVLTGDFKPMETLCRVNSEASKRHPLQSINEDVNYAAKEMKTVNKNQIECLKELANCHELINWIREEIQDERQLRVFVELAMNNAGESAIEVDRVSCFHRAVTGYAPFIFNLESNAGYKTLLEVSQKVWRALKSDEKLPTKLIDTQRQLHWFRQIKESQGDVETSSLIQAGAINRRGIYTIGKLDLPEGSSEETPVLQLIVESEDDETKSRIYDTSELKDLQSKLTLVAVKTREQREGQQNEVDSFVEVFTAAQQLAATYEKLSEAGNILFSDWKALLYCGYQTGVALHIDFGGDKNPILIGTRPLPIELRFLLEFLKKCLEEWYQYVNDRRSEYFHLNYFKTQQLVLLRRCLAQFATSDEAVLPPQVHVLLSAVNHSCTSGDIRSAVQSASDDIMKPHDETSILEEAEEKKAAERKELALSMVELLSDEYGFDEKLAWAAIHELGVAESDEHEAYMTWCVEHAQDEEEVDRLFADLQTQEPSLFHDESSSTMEHDDDGFRSFFSMTQTLHDVTHSLLIGVTDKQKTLEKQLPQLWNEYLHSMKSFDVEDCLSLEHLGLILKHLGDTCDNDAPRSLPNSLKEGVPNLVVRPTDDVLMTVLSLYMHDDGSLPSIEEVLMCSPATSLEEVVLLWRRALSDPLGRIFCLVRADLLDYNISVKAEQELAGLMKGKSGYQLVVVCSSEREDNSHMVTALDQYRREIPASRSKESVKQYLDEQFRMLVQNAEDEQGIETAASLTHHGCNVEMIVSSRPGVGKTLKVQRYKEELIDMLNTLEDEDTTICVTIPLQESVINEDAVVKALLPYQDASPSTPPMIYHLDVAPMVREGLDHLLFNLLILGGLCNSHGQVWECKPQDLYVVEMTDFALQQRHDMIPRIHHAGPFYTILPCVTCHAPQDILTACQWMMEEREDLPPGWQDWDPKVDVQEFSGPSFQRAFQYLNRHSQKRNLDVFKFDVEREPEGEDHTFLITLLNHCGVEDPSWAELSHFANFLSAQLDDCQNSVFCDPVYHDAESGMRGFKTFVVQFMIQMAKDFATPSLNMSEESPSRAVKTINDATTEEEREEDVLTQELEAFQLRRRWETSLHPYIFFNHDRVSMTFMGFLIDRNGSLRDPNTREIIEPNIMTPQLRQALKANGVEVDKDFDGLPRWKKLHKLGMVLGVDNLIDPDETYELTTDNVKKMLAIHMRFRCGIPVVIMGETGCGKTRLIRFLCRLQAGLASEDGLNNMILMKVHGGTTSSGIRRKINRAQTEARQTKEDYGVDTVLFFDEANTTEAIGLIKEIMCDGRVNGETIDMADGALKIVAACNPYRRHTESMVDRLKAAGLGYHVAAEDTQEKLGAIPLRELVYRVQALPPSMLPLVWDFGQLSEDIEAKYIRQIVQRYVNTDLLVATSVQAEIITAVLSASQQFMREQENECSFVSLRDVERCLEVLIWFNTHMHDMLRPLLNRKAQEAAADEEDGWESDDSDEDLFEVVEEEVLDDLTTSLVLAIGVCYHACLQEGRDDYRERVADVFDSPCELHGGADQILEEITRCQNVFLDEVKLDDNIARNAALKENVFMMVVCIDLRIPLFLVGKPGSSKSLAKTIVADAMQGESSRSDLFRNLKQVHMTSHQCSPLSTPDGIVGTFRQCSKFQEGKDLKKFVSVVVLDEVGLAEDSPRMPLKTLHPLLETGSEEDEDTPDPCKKVAFVGLSNWALDPAKMNRGILVSREEPDLPELVETARGICRTDPIILDLIEPLIPSLAKAYLTLYTEQPRKYFGLRDYYSLIKMVYKFCKLSSYAPSWAEIEHSVRRNFGGSSNERDPVEVFVCQPILSTLSKQKPRDNDPDCRPSGLLRASIEREIEKQEDEGAQSSDYNPNKQFESRYLLILTENYAALPIVQQQLLDQDAITIFGSSFPFDQEYTQICRNINRVKVCMETGRTVVLLNLENLYESLYDALNQYYVYFGGQRYVDLGLGTHRVKCRVHEDFRLIVIADKDVVYDRFPIPLINRLEKHFLATSTMLTEDYEQQILEELTKWVKDFASISNALYHNQRHQFDVSDAFIGYHGDTLASLVFQVCNELKQHEGDQEWRESVKDKVKASLLQCATPHSVMRLAESKLLAREVQQIKDDYFKQEHTSLGTFLQHQIQPNEDGVTQDVMAHVTTHSRLLGKRDCDQLQGKINNPVTTVFLQNFHTEQQFCSETREFFNSCKESSGVLLVQCDDGHAHNQLVACASYCIQAEKTEAKEEAIKNKHGHLQPAHVVFVIQLATDGKGFTGFRGTGTWSSFHIDDLQPSQPNRPEISNLRGLGIKNLFERDPDIQCAKQTQQDELETMAIDAVGEMDAKDANGAETETVIEPSGKSDDIATNSVVEDGAEGEGEVPDDQAQQILPDVSVNVDEIESESLVAETTSHLGQLDVARGQEQYALSGLVRVPQESIPCESGPKVIDVTRLLQDSIHDAASRISDSDKREERTTKRIEWLMQLMPSESSDSLESGPLNFMVVIKKRLFQLICDREEKRGGRSDSWLSNEALRVGDVQKSGTFRKAVWQRLISVTSPLLAELIAYCDCNDNLSLLLEHPEGHWQHLMWLAVLSEPKISSILYEDLLSPVHNVLRQKALVRVVGTSGKPIAATLPFSWLLKEFMDTMHTQALDLRAINQSKNIEVIFQNLVIQSPWQDLLNQQIPAEAQEVFMQKYTMDFIKMTYKTHCKHDIQGEEVNVQHELQCVYEAVDITTKLMARQLDPTQGSTKLSKMLVALHLGYAQIQGRLLHFTRLADVYPALLEGPNVTRLTRHEGQMSLDAKAIQMIVESLSPEDRCWKDNGYRQRWLARVEAARPTIDSIIPTIINGSHEVYGEAAIGIVTNSRAIWEKICVLRLFVEHICPPNLDVEEVLANQALLLWKTLRNNKNGMKTIEGLKAVEQVLKVCCSKASKQHFRMGVEDCPLCKKSDIKHPVELPCGKVCCKDCLTNWFRNSNSRGCPACKTPIPEDYALKVTTENKEALVKYDTFRQRCNAFFMDVVSQLCFADGTPPSCEVVERLMTYVTKETAMKDKKLMMTTKKLTAFQGDGIDPNPVIRSILLQLLLQSNLNEVQKYIDQYLQQAQVVLAQHKSQDIIEVCMLFVHCLEDSFHRQAAKHDNPSLGFIEMATDKLRSARAWLQGKVPEEGMTVEYLIAIGESRFGLVAAARFLHDVYCRDDNELELTISQRQIDNLMDEAWEFCGIKSNREAHLFLVRYLCHCYGTSTVEAISEHQTLAWVIPDELQNESISADRFVVCGGSYCSIREAMGQAAITGESNAVKKALKGRHREIEMLLSLFREITMSYGSRKHPAIPQEIREKIKTLIQKTRFMKQKELAECLVDNQYRSEACNQLVIAPGQDTFHQALVAMVMQTVITLQCADNQPLLSPLLHLLQNPHKMQNSFLPTMPEDHRMELKKVIDAQGATRGETYEWYECPNGHLYTIGDCGRPYEQSQCKECGANIGGLRHELTAGNTKIAMADTTATGHVLGEASSRTASLASERHLSPIVLSVLRIIMHSIMMGGAVSRPEDIRGLITSRPDAVGSFLWQHIQADLQLLVASCGRSQDDCLFIVHLVLQSIAVKKQQKQKGWDHLLTDKDSRAKWESAFAKVYIKPIVEKLDEQLAAANHALQSDERFSCNPLLRLLHQQPTESTTLRQEDMCNLHTYPDVWQYRPQVTIKSLQLYLGRQMNAEGADNPFELLQVFLEKDHVLSVLRHLPDIIKLQQILFDQFHRRIDAAEATKMTIQEFLDKAPQDVHQLVNIFISVWNQVRENIPNYGGIQVPHELCNRVLDTSHSLAILLPTRREAGVCSTALVDFLIGSHKEMIDIYHSISKEAPSCDPIQPSDATSHHLATYDKDKDLLPLILAHQDYAMEAGRGTTHTFKLEALQRQIEDRFLRGRPVIARKIQHLVFRQDAHDAAVFQTLRNRIPQKSLVPAIQHQILSQLKSLPDLSDCLAVLVIAIGFLVASPSPPELHISKYLHSNLSLPPERGLQASSKAHEYCRLQHILSLWQTLAVEQARRNNQDPFDDIGQDYRIDIDEDQRSDLKQALRHVNVERLVAELYEYIVLNLKQTINQEQDRTQWSIVHVLQAYVDDKYADVDESVTGDINANVIHGFVEHFPKDLQLKHSVNVWKAIIAFTKQ